MSTLNLLHYNNYYNRIVKFEDDIVDYLDYKIGDPILRVNFNPNDGVDTEQIINWDKSYDIPDYLVVGNANNSTIESRWFVIECARTRGGQYLLTLKRDVIVDNYENIIEAPCFIEKATVDDSDIAIYNKEPYTFNSIKQSEILLKDDTECPWIVGYISAYDNSQTLTGKVRMTASDDMLDYPVFSTTDDYFNSFSSLVKTQQSSTKYSVLGNIRELRLRWNLKDSTNTGYSIASFSSNENVYTVIEQRTSTGYAADKDYLLLLQGGSRTVFDS